MTAIVPNRAVTRVQQSPNYSSGRPAGAPAFIVIHHWGSDGQRHKTVADYLCRSGGSSSAHYVASAGEVTQLVSDRDRAWHAGSSGNPRGIGIECRPEMSAGDFETVADLIAAIRDEHGALPLQGHQQHMATACPGRWQAQLGALSARADAIRSGSTAHVPAAPSASVVESSTSWYLDVDGVWGPKTGARVRAVLGVPTTAPWEGGSGSVVRALQYWLSWALDAYRLKGGAGVERIAVDAVDGPVTVKAFQTWWNHCGVPAGSRIAVDGVWGPETYRAMQIALNHSWAGARALATRP